ncbi:MAG: hypothetical protein AAFP19_20495 [Bacteroidota bacterium]
MRKVINCAFVSLLLLLSLASCNKEEVNTKIYAPNDLLVSESMADLTQTMAGILNMDQKDLSIQSISFLDVKEGFIADVEVYISSTGDHANVLYISPLLEDKIQYDASVKVADQAENRNNPPFIDGFPSAFCSCGGDASPSRNCRISGSLNENGTISLRCFSTGCPDVCSLGFSPAP